MYNIPENTRKPRNIGHCYGTKTMFMALHCTGTSVSQAKTVKKPTLL